MSWFQSTPPAEARGDPASDLSASTSAKFQSTPPAEARGDDNKTHGLINAQSWFQSCAFYLSIRQLMGVGSQPCGAKYPWILRGFQGRLSC